MKSEVEITIENYERVKKNMLEYSRLTSNENVRVGIESFIESADEYINLYKQIKEYKGHGEIVTTNRVVHEKVEEDKYMINNLKSSLEEQLTAMENVYENMRNEKVVPEEKENFDITINTMGMTLYLFKYTMGIAVNKKKDTSVREIREISKRRIIDVDYI